MDRYPQGYGKIAAIEACDPNFLIYRKFAWLHNRLLLHCQDELAQLERQLEELDLYHFREQPRRLISRRRDDVFPDGKRKDLLKAIDAKLLQYREYVSGCSWIRSHQLQIRCFCVCKKFMQSRLPPNATKAACGSWSTTPKAKFL